MASGAAARSEHDSPVRRGGLPQVQAEQSKARRKAYIETLAKTGNVTSACQAAGVSHQSLRRWRENRPRFVQQERAARRRFIARLEAKANTLAEEGWTEVTEVTEPGGRTTVTERERYNPQVLFRVLAANNPRKWAPRRKVEHSGQVGLVSVQLQAKLSDPTVLEVACSQDAALASQDAPGSLPGPSDVPSHQEAHQGPPGASQAVGPPGRAGE